MLLRDLIIRYYEDLARIKGDPRGVASKHLFMEPKIPYELPYVRHHTNQYMVELRTNVKTTKPEMLDQ